MKSLTYRIVSMVAIILVVGALGLLIRRFDSMEWLVENEADLREYVKLHPLQGWLIGFSVYTVFSLIPGTAGKSVVFGWLFGFWAAVLLVDVGLTVAGIAGFAAARFLIRDMVKARFGGLIERLDHGLEKDGAFYLLMMRLAHVPYSFVNYAAGASSVSTWKFCWTTSVGILPGTMIFVFVGTRIPTLASITEKGVWQLFDPLLFAVLAGTVVFPIVTRWSIRRFYQQPVTLPEFEISAVEKTDA
jgi:uncharacterized membrane protein YdjX (TVP38/TMEM64 family)